MQQFTSGKYLGSNIIAHRFAGLIISVSRYESGFSSLWHCHENPYFAFILRGGSLEIRKNENVECTPGMLLYYNTQEPHKNESYKNGSKNFIIEFLPEWFDNIHVDKKKLNGNINVQDPVLKMNFIKMLANMSSLDADAKLFAEASLAANIPFIAGCNTKYSSPPQWLSQLKNMLHEESALPHTLTSLSKLFGVHPVTISKLFPQFYGCTMGEYARKVKIEKACLYLAQKYLALEDVASLCGFADHAHFCRMFKNVTGLTPSSYRAIITG